MKVIQIADGDSRGALAVDLKDVLELMGAKATASRWRISNMDATGNAEAAELDRLSDEREMVDGGTLLQLARNVWQVIDCECEGFYHDQTTPWCIISAIDSTYYEVETDDADVLNAIRAKYQCTSERDGDEYRAAT
jgi:hypothetical protein